MRKQIGFLFVLLLMLALVLTTEVQATVSKASDSHSPISNAAILPLKNATSDGYLSPPNLGKGTRLFPSKPALPPADNSPPDKRLEGEPFSTPT